MVKYFLKNENSKGITLIALVITIVVMLILAGVTINLTLGENGIFTTAQQAAKNYTDSQNKEMAYLQGFTNEVDNIVNPTPLGTIIKTENGINYTADGAGNAIPVPVGFAPITSEDQGTKATGFVIKNTTDGNEFVWIPVGSVANYKRVGWTRDDWTYRQTLNEETGEITRADFGTTYVFTEEMPIDERNSVSTYGGYYIGRYEAGVANYDEDKTVKSNDTVTPTEAKENWTGYIAEDGKELKLVVQDKQQVWNYITRNKAKEVAKDLYNKSTNNVASKLCSSYAWDSALKFIETAGNFYPINSTGGNYYFTSGGTGTLQKTGYYSVNNIYDMGGNVHEWTTETFGDSSYPCVNRGGGYGVIALECPAANRSGNTTTNAIASLGFRIALFM